MNNLFDNPMVRNALKAMTKEQREEYKAFGEHLYGNINFEDGKVISGLDASMEESVAYIEEGIKSGLLPEDLEENEVMVLEQVHGPKWYEKYGWKKEEVPESGLSLQTKKDIEKAVQKKVDDFNKKK